MTLPTPSSSGRSWSAMSARHSINGPLAFSLIALAITCIFVLSGAAALLTSAFGRGTGDAEPAAELDKLVAKHTESMQTWQDRFNGRSVFFKPPAPPRKIEIKEPPPDVPSLPEPPPGPDPVYRGPSVAFAFGEIVYFSPASVNDKFLQIRIGEEKAGVKVISTNLPWSVKVGYKGGEYDVPLFAKSDESIFVSSTPRTIMLTSFLSTVPGVETPAGGSSMSNTVVNPAGEQSSPIAVDPRDPRRNSRRASVNPDRTPRERPQAGEPAAQPAEESADDQASEEEVEEDPVVDDEAIPEEEIEEVQPNEDEGVEEDEPPVPEVKPAAPPKPETPAPRPRARV